MTKKQVLLLAGFIIIVIAIPLTLYLVQRTQIFAPKAGFVPKAEFVNDLGQIITETSNPNVKLKITKESEATTSPLESPSASESASPSAQPQESSPSSLIQNTTLDVPG